MTYKHNISTVKSIFYIGLLSLVVGCNTATNESQSLADLKTQKKELVNQLNNISIKLKSVESAISDLDTLKRLVTVTSFKAEEKNFNHYIEVQGVVKADKTIELRSEMGGTITAILIKQGQKVNKGQVLATLESSVIDNSVLQLKTQLDLATTTYERQARLWEQKIGSEIQFLQIKSQKEGLENSLRSLRAQARKMKITAPFSGTIDQVFAKTGEFISPQVPFLRLVNLDNVYIESEITETYLKSISNGTNALLSFSSIDTSLEASITQVGNFINPSNRSFKTRIDIKNINNELKANLLADIKINDFNASGIVIPSKVIQKDRNGKTFVYTLESKEANYKVVKTFIKDANSYNNYSYVTEGLNIKSTLIDKGARLVKDGDIVKLVD